MNANWEKLTVSRADLQLSPTLAGGQSFRWSNTKTNCWTGVFGNKVWILSQEDNQLLYQAFGNQSNKNMNSDGQNENIDTCSEKDTEAMLRSYFRLDTNLNYYYKLWSEADPYFREVAPKLYGVRILNQDVVENIFSFICSSNNRIERITTMVEKLCELYGDPIAEVNKKTFKSFPTIEKLAGDTVQSDLKKAGFGYRAKYVHQTACLIKKLGGFNWLRNLKLLTYPDAKKNLIKLPGIGAKVMVADCICLMSLGHLEAVPVDTHVFQIATKLYLPHLKKYKSITDKVYNEIGDHFRSLHGPYAGWANTLKGSSLGRVQGKIAVPTWGHPSLIRISLLIRRDDNLKLERQKKHPYQKKMSVIINEWLGTAPMIDIGLRKNLTDLKCRENSKSPAIIEPELLTPFRRQANNCLR